MTEEQENMLREELNNPPKLNFYCFPLKVNYMTSDGKTFDSEQEALRHDERVSRIAFYEHLLAKRNWLQRLFDIKPSMKFYDEMAFKARLNWKLYE